MMIEDPVMSLASNETQTSMLPSEASRTHENYHLDSFHIPKKRRSGNVPHKSPGNKTKKEIGSDAISSPSFLVLEFGHFR
jgi:ABC-type lipopolysaccharide export system ATPase subunit